MQKVFNLLPSKVFGGFSCNKKGQRMSADTRVWNKVMPFRFSKFWFKKNVLHSLLTFDFGLHQVETFKAEK